MVLIKSQNSKVKIQKAGLTLIELLVAFAVFSIVISVAISIFSMSIKSQRQILARQQLLDQTSYILERVSRAVRMAKKDDIFISGHTADCLSGTNDNYEITHAGQGIKLRNYNNDCQEFYLENGQLKETKDGFYTGLALTSENLTVNSFKITNSAGWTQNDDLQPAVSLFLDISGKEGANMKIQTTISQRNLDVKY